MTGQNTVSAGASGAVYGLIGAAVYLMIKNRGRMRPGMLWLRIGVILIFLFYSNFINSGIDAVAHAAGQTVFHYHIHLIPRYEGEKAMVAWTPGEQDKEKLEKALEEIRARLS